MKQQDMFVVLVFLEVERAYQDDMRAALITYARMCVEREPAAAVMTSASIPSMAPPSCFIRSTTMRRLIFCTASCRTMPSSAFSPIPGRGLGGC